MRDNFEKKYIFNAVLLYQCEFTPDIFDLEHFFKLF